MHIHHFMRYKPIWGMKRHLKTYLNLILIFFYEFVCFQLFKKPTNMLHKTPNFAKNQKFCQNPQNQQNKC